MKVIYITNQIISRQEALNWFQFYCDTKDDLYIFQSFDAAKTFIDYTIIDLQKHIDFIVTDWLIASENAQSFMLWLRSKDQEYSNRNFQVKSIPVLLIENKNQQSKIISDGFNATIVDFPGNKMSLRLGVKNSVKSWRVALADDLELIGLSATSVGIIHQNTSTFLSYYKLKILTRNFVDSKIKNLSYLWRNDISLVENVNQQFFDKIKSTLKNPPKYLEKEFHDFFKEHPTIVKGEDYMTSINNILYEKHLYKNGTRKYDEPDFMNKPFEYSLRLPEIFEIKRQSQRILTQDRSRFLSTSKKSFRQVMRYKEYVTSNDPLHEKYIVKYFGKAHKNYDFTLLMGSYEEKKENEDLISSLKSDFDFEDINLITYEELLDRHIKLCNRLEEFNIF